VVKMNIAILGGAGFVGRSLAYNIAAKYPKYKIALVDNFSSNPHEVLDDLEKRPSVSVYEGSISDTEFLQHVFTDMHINVVINATYTEEEASAIETFVTGTKNVLSLVHSGEHAIIKYIHISSDEVYGEDPDADEQAISPYTETSSLRPTNPISALQAGGDLLVQSYVNLYDIPATTLRTGNVFGPGQRVSKLFPSLIDHALRNEDIPIYGDGTHTRDWLYVEDLLDAIDAIIQAPDAKTAGQVFNVSGELELSILEVTELILTILNRPKDLITFDKANVPLHKRRVLDNSKINKAIDWLPEHDVKKAIEDTIGWYKRVLDEVYIQRGSATLGN